MPMGWDWAYIRCSVDLCLIETVDAVQKDNFSPSSMSRMSELLCYLMQ